MEKPLELWSVQKCIVRMGSVCATFMSTSKWAIFCFRTLCTVHFLTHFGNVKDRLKKIGSEKSARGARLTVGGGLKLFGQCPYGHTTFQEGDSLTHGADAVLSVPK